MLPIAPTLAGFRGMRGDVLVAVKKSQPVTAKELAAGFGLTPNAVRRHLKELEAEGLVGCARQVRGVGGPTLGYSLTDAGEALFPRAYDTTLTTLLDSVREQHGADGVVQLFRAQWERVSSGAKEERRALQLGLRGKALERYAQQWLVAIDDISAFVAEQRQYAQSPATYAQLQTPSEGVYPIDDADNARRLGLSG